jgi:hypothetical protein
VRLEREVNILERKARFFKSLLPELEQKKTILAEKKRIRKEKEGTTGAFALYYCDYYYYSFWHVL